MSMSRRPLACGAALAAGLLGGALVAVTPAAGAAPGSAHPQALRHALQHRSTTARPAAPSVAAVQATGPIVDSAVVYVVDNGAGEGIRVRHLATGAVEDVIVPVADAFFADPVLSPDGSMLAYSKASATDPIFRVFVATVSATPNPQPVATSMESQFAPDWSPDGNTLMYSQVTTAAAELQTVDVSNLPTIGAPVTIVADGLEGRYAVCEPNPNLNCLIPGGSKIAYVVSTTDELATVNADGSGETTLGTFGTYPSWSPGTNQLVFGFFKSFGGQALSSTGLATIDLAADGSAAAAENRLFATGSTSTTDEHPSYSHDGSEIYFARASYDAANDVPSGRYDLASLSLDEEGFIADLTLNSGLDNFEGHRYGPDIGHGTASTFTAISPRRILDTRPGAGHIGGCGALGPAATCEFTVAPLGLDVPAGANAVVLNVTGIAPSATTDLRIYPKTGATTAVPTVSNLNLIRGQTAAVAAVVKTGGPASGPNKVILRNAGGVVNVAVDIAGYFQNDTLHDRFHALTPTRIADSRTGLGCPAALGSGGVCTLTVTDGAAALPAAATAVVFNLTGLSGSTGTDLRAYPGDATSVPNVSNLNLPPRTTRANLVTVALPVGSDTVKIRNSGAATHVVVDVAGYYTADATDPAGSLFHPVDPVRILDTRYGQKTSNGAPLRLGAGQVEQVVSHDTVTTVYGGTELATRATSLVGNLTVVAPSAATDVRAYPADLTALPGVSNVNAPANAVVPNLVFVTTASARLSRGDINLRNAGGTVSLIFDVAGFFEDS